MAQPNQDQDPEWKGLINQLANLNGKQSDIQAVATNAAEIIQQQSQILIAVSSELEKILNKLKSTPSSAQIQEALQKANGDQVVAIDALIKNQNDALTPQLNTLKQNVENVQRTTNEITNAQNPQQPGAPSVGGKRRRRTRNKEKKYHKRTKRGGYTYDEKKKGKKSPKKNK